jgi:hypothetical protein
MLDDETERRENPQLSEEELLVLRKMIKSEQHMQWLWCTMRNTAVWIVAIITCVTVAYSFLSNMLKHMIGK